MLRFEKIDDKYCNQYIEMVQEWKASNTSLTPDILEIPCNNEIEYRNIVSIAKNAAIGIHEDRDWYEKCNYYLVVNDQDKLIGITAVRSNLTQLGKDTLGNIAYGIRPSERRKGYAKAVANMLVNKCRELGMNEIVACHYIENDASKRVLESAGAIPTGVLTSEYSGKKIKRYIIRTNTSSEINFTLAKQVFNDYVKKFDREDGSILLKITHTYHVVDLSEYIAKEQGLDEENVALAKLIALLHDIGRFKQVTLLRNFSDKGFDHADYGVKILFAENLIKDIPDNGSVIIYNRAFEPARNREIAEMYPDLKDELERINCNMIDFLEPFKQRKYYTKEMQGSASIKYVLPALYQKDSELDYHNLPVVHNGEEASEAFLSLKGKSKEKQKEIRNGLLVYCQLDTYAMVKIWMKFKQILSK